MTLWLIFAAMGLVAAGLLAWALLRAGAVTGERSEYDLQVFRAQLSELDREAELGLVSDEDAAAARLEIERRMLAADAARGRGPSGRLGRSGRIAAVGISLAVPVAAIAVYLELGAPGVPSVPHSEPATVAQTQGPDAHAGAGEAGSGVPDVAAMVSRLEQRLADNPDDLEGWAMLGRSYIVLNRPEDALKALDHALALDDTLPVLHSARGEALVMAADGIVTPKAREAFGRALALDPEDARARFYMAMGRAQEGDTRGAFDDLVALMKAGGPEAPWYQGVYQQAATMAGELGLDAATVLPAPPALAMAAGNSGTPADPAVEAKRLAAQLADNPKDYQGWIRLAQLRAGLGDRAGARDALDRGAAAFPGAPFVQQQFQQAAAALGLNEGGTGSAGGTASAGATGSAGGTASAGATSSAGGTASAGATDSAGGTRGPSAEDVQAAQQMTNAERDQMIRGMVGNLAARLKDDPNDLEGWRMLARSYGVLGETDKSVAAYAHLAERQPDDAAAQLDYARALVERDGGRAEAPDTLSALRRVLELDANNPDALFYLGDAAQRDGDQAAARRYFEKLIGQLDPASREHAMVQARLKALAE